MSHILVLDGYTWTRQSDRCCLCCGARTFRMSRRTHDQLIWARYPGPNGAHQFRAGRLFVVCHSCFTQRFTGDRQSVLAWNNDLSKHVE